MKKTVVAVVALLAAVAQASPRRLVVATGDCKEADLNGQARAFHETLSARPGEDVLTVAAFAQRLFPQNSGSFEDLRRQLDGAQGLFYEARYAKAAQAVDEVLAQLPGQPPGEARWKLYVSAQLLHGLNFRALGKEKESDAAFRQVLRVEPGYQLDPDYYTPATRRAFEAQRRELARSPKVKLAVKSTQPGSEVYLEGRRVGQTPLALEVPAGTYELTVKKGAAVSFPRQLEAAGPEVAVLVDLAYEGSVSASPFPCLSTSGEPDKVLGHAVRLGGTLGVEEVIAVRLEPASSGPRWLAATVLNVEGGQKLREGGFKTQGVEAGAEALAALVDFVTTGKARPELVVLKPDSRPPWDTESAEPSPELPPRPAEKLPAPALELSAAQRLPEPGAPGVRPLRLASYVTLGVGVAALGAAGTLRLTAQPEYEALRQRLNEDGLVAAEDTQGQRLLQGLAQKNLLMSGLLIGSGVALATGTALFFLSAEQPQAALSVGVAPTPGGATATVAGHF